MTKTLDCCKNVCCPKQCYVPSRNCKIGVIGVNDMREKKINAGNNRKNKTYSFTTNELIRTMTERERERER